MNDQTQQNGEVTPSKSLASNPWEGEDEPGEQDVASTQQTTGQATEQTATEQRAEAATPAGLTQEQIAEIVSRTVGTSVPAAIQQHQAAQPKAMTTEDFEKSFNVFKPTPEMLAKVGLPATPEGAEIFRNEVVMPIVRQAVTMSAYQMEKLKADLTSEFKKELSSYEPARQLAEERAMEKVKEQFFKAHPDLREFEPLVIVARDRLKGQGTTFKTVDEAIKAVADETRSLLATIPNVQRNGEANSQTTQSNGAHKTHSMSALSGAGQGGAGGSRGATKPKSVAEELWG